jgi:hypothetical protein
MVGTQIDLCCLRHRNSWLHLHSVPREVAAGSIDRRAAWGSSLGLLRSYRTRICLASVSCRPPSFTAYVNLCFVMGQLIANGVIARTSTLNSH